MSTPDWLAVVEDQIIVCLNPKVLTQIEHDNFENGENGDDRIDSEQEIIYRLNSQDLLGVLASSVGLSKINRQGAIVIWTYYSDTNENFLSDPQNLSEQLSEQLSERSPILRTLITIDGDMHQKVCYEILEHPLGDRILKAHSYIIGQISGQFKTVIGDYLDSKLRPLSLATISMVTVLTWCDPLRQIGKYLNLPDFVFGNCWLTVAVVPIAIFIIWWFNSKLSFRLPSLPNFLNSGGKFNQQSFQKNLQKNLQKLGKYLLRLLDGRIFRFVAIAVIGCLCLSWLFLALEKLPVDSQIVKVISMIESYIEPYLPIAIISLRKLIMDNLGTIFFKSAFIVKFIFGRFVR